MFITQAIAQTAPKAAEAATNFPPFDTSSFASQLFWLAITFGGLYYVMANIALPRVAGIIEDRRNRIASDLESASAAQRNADEAGAAYEKTLTDAKASAQKNVQELRDKLAVEADARRRGLEADLNARLADAEQQITAMKTQAMTNVSAIASDAAAAIVSKLTGREADPRLLADAINGQKAA